MTPEQRSLVMALVTMPGQPARISPEEFLAEFGVDDGVGLGFDLLRDAVTQHDPIDVQLALVVCFKFGFSDSHLDFLIRLAFADWHQQHEDVATGLGRIGSPSAVDALRHLAIWVPSYLEYDDARALATKAIWALGSIRSADSCRVLDELARSNCAIVAAGAQAQLRR